MSKFKITLASTLIGTALLLVVLGNRPDQDLHFRRVVHSELPPERLWRSIDSVTRWPQWFFSLAQAEGPSLLEAGSRITLKIDPNKGARKRFSLQAELTQVKPNQKIALRILTDSSERATRQFEDLEWEIEFFPEGSGTRIEGSAKARTRTFRARVMAQLAETIVMNQLFYPNLSQLADMRQPFIFKDSAPPNVI